jgi:hypothetical protein
VSEVVFGHPACGEAPLKAGAHLSAIQHRQPANSVTWWPSSMSSSHAFGAAVEFRRNAFDERCDLNDTHRQSPWPTKGTPLQEASEQGIVNLDALPNDVCVIKEVRDNMERSSLRDVPSGATQLPDRWKFETELDRCEVALRRVPTAIADYTDECTPTP